MMILLQGGVVINNYRAQLEGAMNAAANSSKATEKLTAFFSKHADDLQLCPIDDETFDKVNDDFQEAMAGLKRAQRAEKAKTKRKRTKEEAAKEEDEEEQDVDQPSTKKKRKTGSTAGGTYLCAILGPLQNRPSRTCNSRRC